MKIFTIVPELGSIGHSPASPFFRILLSLPPQCRQFILSGDFLKNNAQLADILLKNKVKTDIGIEKLDQDAVVYADIGQKLEPGETYLRLKDAGVNFLYYLDQADAIDHVESKKFTLDRGEFFLYSSERQMFYAIDKGCFSVNNNAIEALLDAGGGQGAAVGLMRETACGREAFWRETAGDAPMPENIRAALRPRLEEDLGVKFNPGLPLLVHFIDYYLDLNGVARGLNALSRTANVLCVLKRAKSPACDPEKFSGPNMFVCSEPSGSLANLIRFAADFLLLSCFTGQFPAALMMGLRVLPVYTQNVPFAASPEQITSYTFQLRVARGIHLRAMEHITPVCVESPAMINGCLNDSDYWRRYDATLPILQQNIFGRYLTDEKAMRRAGSFIMRLTQGGGFFPDGTLIYPIDWQNLNAPPGVVL